MAREVQEEDSSSPSASLELIQADRTGTAGERIKLQFSDGSCFFVTDSDLRGAGLSALDLLPGMELSAALAHRLERNAVFREVKEKALDLLARAPHTTFSLRVKLMKRRFPSPVVEEVLKLLGEERYLNDRSFAENWLRSRSERRPEGRAALIAGLLRKGVGREIAEGMVSRYLTPAREQENALRALEKLERSGETDPNVLKRKLRARGFPYPLIRRVVEQRRGE
jgi:regulatory protein